MGVKTYMGVPGFAVEAHSQEDVYEALDRLHTQISDEVEIMESVHERSPGLESDKLEELNHTLRVLENAMCELN
jgi:hypothetical protein